MRFFFQFAVADLSMGSEPESGWKEFKKLLSTFGVILAIAAVVALLAWLSKFWFLGFF